MRNILLVSVNGFTFKACLLITCLWMSFLLKQKIQLQLKQQEHGLSLLIAANTCKVGSKQITYLAQRTPEPKWRLALEQLRIPLGRVMSRTYFDVQEYSSLQTGMPNGEYLVVQFQTSFTNKETCPRNSESE